MNNQKKRAANLLNRIIFVDLARAIATDRKTRKNWLKDFIKPENIRRNYRVFRNSIRTIYNVRLPLDNAPPPTREQICKAIRSSCDQINLERNIQVAEILMDFVEKQECDAYFHEVRSLRIAPQRAVGFEIGHYLVRDGKPVFQYPYPRTAPLQKKQVRVMTHLIRAAYCIDDFEDADVELIEMSKPDRSTKRQCLVHSVNNHPPFAEGEMEEEIASVHGLLMEIASE